MTQPNKVSPRWRVVAIGAILIALVFAYLDHGWDVDREEDIHNMLKVVHEKDVADAIEMRRQDSIISLSRAREIAHAEKSRRDSIAWQNEKKAYQRALSKVNTSRYTPKDLDSTHLALYGDIRTDTTHTIDLGVSRLLTGDAIRVPIMQAHIDRQNERYDSAATGYNRIISEAHIQLEASENKTEVAERNASMWEQTAIEQNNARAEDAKKWKRQRTWERIGEGALIVLIAIVAL